MSIYQKKGKIFSINISRKKGGKKYPVAEAVLDARGIIGDGHSGDWHRQVSLLSYESIKCFNKKGKIHTAAGDFAENITTSGIDLVGLKKGDRLIISNMPDLIEDPAVHDRLFETGSADENPAVSLEVTQVGKECHNPCSIYYKIGSCIMPSEGIFCRVLKTGKIKVGDSIYIV